MHYLHVGQSSLLCKESIPYSQHSGNWIELVVVLKIGCIQIDGARGTVSIICGSRFKFYQPFSYVLNNNKPEINLALGHWSFYHWNSSPRSTNTLRSWKFGHSEIQPLKPLLKFIKESNCIQSSTQKLIIVISPRIWSLTKTRPYLFYSLRTRVIPVYTRRASSRWGP